MRPWRSPSWPSECAQQSTGPTRGARRRTAPSCLEITHRRRRSRQRIGGRVGTSLASLRRSHHSVAPIARFTDDGHVRGALSAARVTHGRRAVVGRQVGRARPPTARGRSDLTTVRRNSSRALRVRRPAPTDPRSHRSLQVFGASNRRRHGMAPLRHPAWDIISPKRPRPGSARLDVPGWSRGALVEAPDEHLVVGRPGP